VRSPPPQSSIAPLLTDRTGFHATTATEFAEGFEKALGLDNKLAMRLRARQSAQRFTEEEFAKKWISQMEKLVKLRQLHKLHQSRKIRSA
jgi:alpha-1,2-mannosyltransferase